MKQSKWFVIVNPTSGSGKGKKHWSNIEQLLRSTGIDFEVAFSQRRAHCIELATQAVAEGYRHIIGVGGDGTANEIINGIFAQSDVPTASITFALVPVGTGNDWIRTHGIPAHYKKAILLIKTGKTQLQDIGLAQYTDMETGEQRQRHFLNVAGMGYDAYVTHASMKRSRWLTDKLFYLYLILSCTLSYKTKRARVTFNGQTVEEDWYSMAMGICRYNGGGAQFVPHAIPDDGLLALTLIKKVSAWEVVKNSRRFYNGRITDNPKVSTFQTDSILVEAAEGAEPTWVEVDGEFLGQTPVQFSIFPQALQIIVP